MNKPRRICLWEKLRFVHEESELVRKTFKKVKFKQLDHHQEQFQGLINRAKEKLGYSEQTWGRDILTSIYKAWRIHNENT